MHNSTICRCGKRTRTAWMAMDPHPQPISSTWSDFLMPALSMRASSLLSCACFSDPPARYQLNVYADVREALYQAQLRNGQ